MKEIIKMLGEMAIHKMRLINSIRKKGEYADNLRNCPIYSEFYGMLQTLNCMEIDFDIDFSPNDVYEMTSITIMGTKFDVKEW